METDRIIFGVIGVVTVVAVALILISSTKSQKPVSRDVVMGDARNYKGSDPKSAKLVVVEFSDFECPFCAQYPAILKSLTQKYPNDLSVVYRHFPLPSHPGSVPAAKAAEAAGMQGKFWEYAETLFLNQPDFGSEQLKKYAQMVGLDTDKFSQDMNGQEATDRVNADAEISKQLNLSGTPTFFIIQGDQVEKLNLQGVGDLENKVKEILGEGVAGQDTANIEPMEGETPGETDTKEEDKTTEADAVQELDLSTLSGEAQNLITKFKEDLVVYFAKEKKPTQKIAEEDVKIVKVELVNWDDSSLGCPKEGLVYSQAIVPGYKLGIIVKEQPYEFHTDKSGKFVDCTPAEE